jgi:transcriptional regulator with GAF, ATPase, and Fis domain
MLASNVGLVASNYPIARVHRQAAPSRSAILIIGETGVGKDVAADEIYRLSGRKGRYIPVNCSALGEGLIESELFGHERGAFTSVLEPLPRSVLSCPSPVMR